MLVPVTLSHSEGRLGIQIGPETFYFNEQDVRQILRKDPTPHDILRAMARRLAADGVNPRTATFAQLKTSIERDPLDV
jgi:hypothetical protein